MLWERVSKALLKSKQTIFHWLFFFLVQQGSHFIRLVRQDVSHKSMLTPSSHILIFNIFGYGFQDYMVSHLPWDWGEFYQPIILLLDLLEDRNSMCFLQSLGKLPQYPQLFKDYQEWLWNVISQLPQQLVPWICACSVCKCSLTWSSSTEGEPSWLQTFPLVSGTWNSWRQVLPKKKTVTKKVWSTLAFFML